ncbi:MAG: ATP-binding cassette domain-containing protein [Hyphomicrobiales bacterium]
MTEPAIRTEGLTKDYGDVLALDQLDLVVEAGEIVGFLGPNGAGKSTTIRLLFDLIRPTSGRAAIFGHDCQADSVAARKQAGYLAGDLRLYENLTARETFRYVARLRNEPVDDEYAAELARRFELNIDRPVRALSKGNRQKVGIILALMARPPLLVLDEPASGLDPLVQHSLWQVLREEADRGAAVFFSSHVMSEVEAVCHRVAILRQGRLAAFEPIDKLRGRSMRHMRVTFADGAHAEDFGAIEGVSVVSRNGSTVNLEVRSNINAVVQALARHTIVDLESEPPSLDEIILSYYEQPK